MLPSDPKTSIRAAQIFALFLGTPPIKPKWKGKSHYGSGMNKVLQLVGSSGAVRDRETGLTVEQ